MYRVIPHKVLIFIIGWIAVGLGLAGSALNDFAKAQWIGPTQQVALLWWVLAILLLKPVWRWLWRQFPSLNDFVFPDLNGEWEAEFRSNHSIQRQLVEAAAGRAPAIDIEHCPAADLVDLIKFTMRAEIDQGWTHFEMKIFNPANDTPIDRSNTSWAEPFKRMGLNPSGIMYIFKQRNQTANIADDREFYGAARLEYDGITGELRGTYWTERVWQRGINTAGLLTLRKIPG